MQTFVTLRGDAVAVPIARRRPPITPAQARNRRNALWLQLHEHGLPDPITGKPRCMSVADLAGMFERSRQTILNGLAAARALRKYVREVAAGA